MIASPTAAHAATGDPYGSFDVMQRVPGGLLVGGWAIDPDTTNATQVHVYVGTVGTALVANGSRSDVGNHGFSAVVPVTSAGTFAVCAYGINIAGPGTNTMLSPCKTITIGFAPFGSVDLIQRVPTGLRVAGWVLDPDSAASTQAHVYVNGTTVAVATNANLSRSDIASLYPGYGAAHGFDVTFAVPDSGTFPICVYGINVAGTLGANSTLNPPCQTTVISHIPFGSIDNVTVNAAGTSVTLQGWAIDPDSASPIAVHSYLGGSFAATTANIPRSDLGAAYPGYGNSHAFAVTVPFSAEPSTGGNTALACSYGINVGIGGNQVVGCSGATGSLPTSQVDTNLASSPGDIYIGDPDTVYGGDYWDYTFGTRDPGFGTPMAKCGSATWVSAHIPVVRTPAVIPGSNGANTSTMGGVNCILADALPNGARYPNGTPMGAGNPDQVWAPSVVYFGGQWQMFFGFRKGAGDFGQLCIGRATSSSLAGPYQAVAEFACPSGGFWALDPDAFVDNGTLYVAFRDDSILASSSETSLIVVSVNPTSMTGNFGSKRVLINSTNVNWDNAAPTNVIENPSMFKGSDGNWWLLFSGNRWEDGNYATGLAPCGASVLSPSACGAPIGGANRPYFGRSGSNNPVHSLPWSGASEFVSPGGMSVYTGRYGEQRVVWHRLGLFSRRTLVTGVLTGSPGAWTVPPAP